VSRLTRALPQTTRGTGADVIIVDEAAHIDPKLFFKTIVPILSMANTSLLCLSSPEGDSNYYSQLLGLNKPDGTPFFNVVNCFQICAKCLKLERVKQIDCTHIKSTAHWLSSRKIRELKTLYKVRGTLAEAPLGSAPLGLRPAYTTQRGREWRTRGGLTRARRRRPRTRSASLAASWSATICRRSARRTFAR